MPRRNDAWDHWYDDLGVSTGRLQRQVKCKFCPLTIAYRADRMFAHLGYRHPQGGVRDVSIRKMVPRSAKQLFENCGGIVPTLPTATLESVNDVRAEEEVEELEPVLSQCGVAAGIATKSHCSHLRAPFHHFERLMTHPHGNYVNVLYLKASMLQRRKSLTEFGRRPFTKQTYPSTW